MSLSENFFETFPSNFKRPEETFLSSFGSEKSKDFFFRTLFCFENSFCFEDFFQSEKINFSIKREFSKWKFQEKSQF